MRRRVAHHPTPAAAQVEQAHPGAQPEFARNQVELLLLGLLEAGVGLGKHRAGVGHRRAEHLLVEGVGDVVVVTDRVRVALAGVPQSLGDPAPARQSLLAGRFRRHQPPPAQLLDQGRQLHGRRWTETPLAEQPQRLVRVTGMDALEVEVARDVRPDHPEVTGRGGQETQPALVLQPHRDRRPRPQAAAVGLEPQRWRVDGELRHHGCDRHLRLTAFA